MAIGRTSISKALMSGYLVLAKALPFVISVVEFVRFGYQLYIRSDRRSF